MSWAQALPGDVVGFPGHVAIYLGTFGGRPYILEASWVGTPIHIVPLTRTDVDDRLYRYWTGPAVERAGRRGLRGHRQGLRRIHRHRHRNWHGRLHLPVRRFEQPRQRAAAQVRGQHPADPTPCLAGARRAAAGSRTGRDSATGASPGRVDAAARDHSGGPDSDIDDGGIHDRAHHDSNTRDGDTLAGDFDDGDTHAGDFDDGNIHAGDFDDRNIYDSDDNHGATDHRVRDDATSVTTTAAPVAPAGS